MEWLFHNITGVALPSFFKMEMHTNCELERLSGVHPPRRRCVAVFDACGHFRETSYMCISQVQQMRQLREKVRAMRAETEASLGAVTVAAEEAKARRSGSGEDGPVSPRTAPDLGRLQVRLADMFIDAGCCIPN